MNACIVTRVWENDMMIQKKCNLVHMVASCVPRNKCEPVAFSPEKVIEKVISMETIYHGERK